MGIWNDTILGAFSETSDLGSAMAPAITSKMTTVRRAPAQRLREHVSGQAVDLGVELQGRDGVAGARHLEVHVTEGVLRPQDVGERDVATVLDDESHGDAGH